MRDARRAAKRVIFLTGTRADYGKLKPIMLAVDADPGFEAHVFITGMHMHREFGSTYTEVVRDGYKNTYPFINQRIEGDANMDIVLAETIRGLSDFAREVQPDLIVVHGDRVEALAGAIVAATNNVLLVHIEGGELSGTVDGSIRHAITKLAHVHLVANMEARERVLQLGEDPASVHVIGSPDIDVMLGSGLPSIHQVKQRYEIPYTRFGVATLHPVTTDYTKMLGNSEAFVSGLLATDLDYVIIHPNNDLGRAFVMEAYKRLAGNARFRLLPSMRFEYFLTLLKHASVIVGNSSAGIREAGVYGVPSVDVGDRQIGRYRADAGILHADYDPDVIAATVDHAIRSGRAAELSFGAGDSTERFMDLVKGAVMWESPLQKPFFDLAPAA
ncbi:MAG TPA: UDP-N-acetylglucosamine 2-epimerase [Solirubrobacteraceae bacterium]|nr:UDP-N-acetylglucosamine 2-epimerase [Solirubrobacteraceae bacterium]